MGGQYHITDCGPLHLYDGIEQGSQEWLELREDKVTCSNAYDLLVRGPLFCMKKNRTAATRLTPNGNSYADRGHAIEADVKRLFNNTMAQSGYEIADFTFMTNDFFPSAGYSPDGLIVDGDGDSNFCNFIPVEVKAYNDVTTNPRTGETRTPNKHIKAVESFDNVPINAQCQVQMEMLLTGADRMFLLLANPECVDKEKRFKVWTVNFDPIIGKRLADILIGEDKIFEVWQNWGRSLSQFLSRADDAFIASYKKEFINASKTQKLSEKLLEKLS